MGNPDEEAKGEAEGNEAEAHARMGEVQVTTNPKNVAEFLRHPVGTNRIQVVFCTYQVRGHNSALILHQGFPITIRTTNPLFTTIKIIEN